MKFKHSILAMMIATAMSASAGAAQVSDYLLAGSNVLEDDSGELVLRPDGAGGFVPVTGALADGDIFIGVIDFPQVNATNIDGAGIELNGIFAGIVDVTGAIPNVFYSFLFPTTGATHADCGGPCTGGGLGGLTMNLLPLPGSFWLSSFGIDLSAPGLGLSALEQDAAITVIYEDPANDLALINPGGQAPTTAIGNVTDGTIRVVGLHNGDPLSTTASAPASLSNFAAGLGGVSTKGGFNYTLDVGYQNFPGILITSEIVGSGTLVTTNTEFPLQDDTQARFTIEKIPEPATLSLLGLGLLGLAGTRRNKVA